MEKNLQTNNDKNSTNYKVCKEDKHMLKFIKSPCLNCEDRKINCHSKCDKYHNYKMKLYEDRNVNDQYLAYLTERGGGYDRMRTKRGVMRL